MSAYLELVRLHAPLLAIIAPLVGAALAFVCPWPRVSWGVGVASALAGAALLVDMAWRLLLAGDAWTFIVEGVALDVDGVSVFAAALIAATAALSMIAAGARTSEFAPRVVSPAIALALCMPAGWIGALMASDLIGVFVAIELAWLASVGLLALSADRAALSGALRMLAGGGAGAALFLCGAGLLYRSAGSLDLSTIAAAHIGSGDAAAIGAGLMLVAIALKAGVAPLHEWLGAAFTRASRFALIALGVVGVVGALAVMVRLASYFIQALEIGEGVAIALAVLGGASVVIGSLQAVGATNMRRLAAYAGAAQAGCILLCVALGSPAGFAAALVQLTAFAAAALALFGGVAAGGVVTLQGLDGLGRRAPLAGAAILAGAISLMGAPLTLGFLGRWRLVEAGVGAGWWWAAGAVIFASLAGVFYGGRVVERLYFRRAGEVYPGDVGPWRFAVAPLLIAAIATILLGVAPAVLLQAADAAAAHVLGVGA